MLLQRLLTNIYTITILETMRLYTCSIITWLTNLWLKSDQESLRRLY